VATCVYIYVSIGLAHSVTQVRPRRQYTDVREIASRHVWFHSIPTRLYGSAVGKQSSVRTNPFITAFLPRDAMQARPWPSCGVCLSVTFVHSVETNEHIFKFFSPSGSHTILVFPYQMAWQYSDGNPPPLTGR